MSTNILHASDSCEWYTSDSVLALVRKVMGAIDLDPASCVEAQTRVQATDYFTVEQDGLSRTWWGRVFLNPPYGLTPGGRRKSSQGAWTEKLRGEYECGNVKEAILLVNATPDRTWFHPLWDYWVSMGYRRERFISPAGANNAPTHGNALVYFGADPDTFCHVTAKWGRLIPPREVWAKAVSLL